MVKHVLSEIQNNEPLVPTFVKQYAPCVTTNESLVPIAVKKVKLDTSCVTLTLTSLKSTSTDPHQDQNRAEITSISGIYEALSSYLSITMSLTSPQTTFASLQTLVETVMQHPNSEHFSDAQMNLLNRLQDDVRLCMKENKNMINSPDAHTAETIPAKLFTLNLKDGNFE
jgi:hypothetical protein